MVAQLAATPRPFPTMPDSDPAEFESLADYRAAWDSWCEEHDLAMAERVAFLDAKQEEWDLRLFHDQQDAEAIYWQEMDGLTAAHLDRQTDVMFHTVGVAA